MGKLLTVFLILYEITRPFYRNGEYSGGEDEIDDFEDDIGVRLNNVWSEYLINPIPTQLGRGRRGSRTRRTN